MAARAVANPRVGDLDGVATLGAASREKRVGHNQANLLRVRHLRQNLRRWELIDLVWFSVSINELHRL
jgi:hypothetical protein